MVLTAIVFLIILSALVLIHELGHFLVAKKFNIKVEEFGFGLPPRLWGVRRGETIYSLNWLPIGGFVKLYGEDDAGAGRVSKGKALSVKSKEKDLDRAFFSRSVSQRALVVAAGVIMNTLLAIGIFYLFMFVSGFKAELPLLSDHRFFGANQSTKTQVLINGVAKDSPAQKAGVPQLAQVVAVDNQKVVDLDQFIKLIKAKSGKPTTLTYKDPTTQKQVSKTLIPRANPPKNQGAIGVSLFAMQSAVLEYTTPVQKLFSGIIHPANLLVYNFELIGKLVSSAIKDKDATQLSQGVAGPVGIYSLVGTIVKIPDLKERVLQILNLAGILSISLAFFNVLPIPALDGGRLFFILFEGVTGRKVNPRYEAVAHTIGMALLLVLILLITFKDIFQFIL